MTDKEFKKLQNLVNAKNDLITDINNLESEKTFGAFIYSHIANALNTSENGIDVENVFAKLCVEKREALDLFIKNMLDTEILVLSQKLDDIERKIESIKIDF